MSKSSYDNAWDIIDWEKDTQEEVLKKTKNLIETGANPNTANENGLTPLMYAVEKNYVDITRTLIAGGADVNAKDKVGNTALMRMGLLSCFGIYPNADIVKELIENGANTKVKNIRGRKAINYPKKSDIRDLIRNARPDPVKLILNYVQKAHNNKQYE